MYRKAVVTGGATEVCLAERTWVVLHTCDGQMQQASKHVACPLADQGTTMQGGVRSTVLQTTFSSKQPASSVDQLATSTIAKPCMNVLRDPPNPCQPATVQSNKGAMSMYKQTCRVHDHVA